MTTVNVSSVFLNNEAFSNNTNIVNVNLNNVTFVNNDATKAFYNCTNLSSVTNLSNTITELNGTFCDCSNLTETPIIPPSVVNTCEIIKDANYYAWDLNKAITDEWTYTQIRTLFIETNNIQDSSQFYYNQYGQMMDFTGYVYITSVSGNVAQATISTSGSTNSYRLTRNSLKDEYVELDEYYWQYNGLFQNCTNITNLPILNSNVQNMDCMFNGCTNITSCSIPNSVNSAVYAYSYSGVGENITLNVSDVNLKGCFKNCYGINTVNITGSNISLVNTFNYCNNLTDVTLCGSGINIDNSFGYCVNLSNVSMNITTTSFYQAFAFCYSLTVPPSIPDGVIYTALAFYKCNNITSMPNIPSTVTNVYALFSDCTNIQGDVFIHSSSITNANRFFYNTNNSLNKNIYIPFTYQNGTNTLTYNSFISAGYKTDSRVYGALLMDINSL